MSACGQIILSVVLLAYSGVVVSAASTCCHFESSSACTGWPTYGLGWYSTATKIPNWSATARGKVSYDSDYLWTQNIGDAILTSVKYTGVSNATMFSFLYYADVTGSGSLIVSFVTTTGVTYQLANLVDVNKYTEFSTYAIDCSVIPCCPAGTNCDGSLTFFADFTSGDALFAIDNVESDGGCVNPICCTFTSTSICGWSNESPSLPWEWSGFTQPNKTYIPNFKPETSDYGWLQVINSAPPANSILESPQFSNVNINFNFTIRYYVDISPLSSDNSLMVYFQEDGDYSRVTLATLYYTSQIWQSLTFFCTGLTGKSCCAGGATCSGHLELDPSNARGQLFYAIDNIAMNNQCFP